ncbi:MAG: nuclear transport factor 2 family protein [Bacteroidales bacterium]|nr:nuclear transport factor 2 family protein [Bacteroidales bacterium]
MMKRIIMYMLALVLTLGAYAQDAVNFEISDGVTDPALKSNIERNTSMLLSAINQAESSGKDINYSGINIDNLASQSIGMMWNNVHFRIADDDIVEHCLQIKSSTGAVIEYQVRNIAVEMKPFDDSYDGDINQEVCINYDRRGNITDFNITMGVQQYMSIIREGERLNDADRRIQILQWVERFKMAYIQKNMNFMEDVFSDDALIVTGRVVKRVHSDIKPVSVEYTSYGKQQYLKHLKGVFARNSYINVKFDDIEIVRHGAKPNYYGVTLKQGWFTKNYSDEGILFIIWDFSDELHPQILVRTWQPMEVDENDIFTLSNFKLK